MGSHFDLIIAAPTAGGKTEAAFLPLISKVMEDTPTNRGFNLLCVSPLKALITDQASRLSDICRGLNLPVTPWHGDVASSIKTRALTHPSGILLITPESLEALFVRKGADISRLFRSTVAVVIDELHNLLDSERGVQTRSLLTRLELSVGRPIRRIGLSATLGDLALARTYLRPDRASEVKVIENKTQGIELRLQLRGYLFGSDDENEGSASEQVTAHIFDRLRGTDNLVFAGSRHDVEMYADKLRELCERERLPQEFYPHHANLSREHRNFVEARLKDASKPTTAVCTSTLELGIDIGDVSSVAQIGAPFSVSALRQRLGRSGRREGKPAILRQYSIESELSSESSFSDRLRLGFVRAVAMIELLLEGWCEPPKSEALHLSTLVHQVLSIIAERSGARASQLYQVLCIEGPFRNVTVEIFLNLLRDLGSSKNELIEQTKSGVLLLGRVGEKLVNHFNFYTVFVTPEEFRLVCDGKDLGTLPLNDILLPGMVILFSGRRWLIKEILETDRVIIVSASERKGQVPVFGGAPGDLHDRVIDQMFHLLENERNPRYLDHTALRLLDAARQNYDALGLCRSSIISLGERRYGIATRVGTVKTTTLAIALRRENLSVEQHDGFVLVFENENDSGIRDILESILRTDRKNFLDGGENLMFEKYHWCLTRELLALDALSSKVSTNTLADLCREILNR